MQEGLSSDPGQTSEALRLGFLVEKTLLKARAHLLTLGDAESWQASREERRGAGHPVREAPRCGGPRAQLDRAPWT